MNLPRFPQTMFMKMYQTSLPQSIMGDV